MFRKRVVHFLPWARSILPGVPDDQETPGTIFVIFINTYSGMTNHRTICANTNFIEICCTWIGFSSSPSVLPCQYDSTMSLHTHISSGG
jgi:hypothetical protein